MATASSKGGMMMPGREAAVRTRRRLLGGSAGLAMLGYGALAGCAPRSAAPQAGNTGAVASQANAAMEAWCHADTRSAWQKVTLDDYNQEKGYGVTINWTKYSSAGEVADKLVVTMAAGSGFPDLADVEISQMGKLLKTPTPPLVAFNDALKGRENDFFKPSFVDPWTLNGKYYGLGNELNVCLLCYRHDLFDRVGIKAPLKTWDEVVEAGKRIAAVSPEGLFMVRTGTAGTFHMLAVAAGGGYLDKGVKLQLNQPANARALQYLTDLIHKHRGASIIFGDRPEGDPGSALFKDAVNTGKVAGELGPTWRISGGMRVDAPDTGGQWMVQHMPQWGSSAGRVTTTWGGTGMTVLKESKFKEVAVDFVVWEHGTKAVLRDFELRQVWPTYKKAYDDPRLTEPVPWFNNQRIGQFLREGAETMLPFHQGVWWPEISSGAGKHIKAALMNEKPVTQALEEAQQEARAAIENAGGVVGPDGQIQGI
jgi:arabinosaccharide transport system substrate-binding protein